MGMVGYRFTGIMGGMIARFKAASRVEKVIAVLATIALAMTLYYMGALVIAEQVFNGVCAIFWAMGRAMLNGLTLYEDILETKPPLIFAMSAISTKLFGNQAIGYIYHTILLFAVPAMTVWYGMRRLKKEHAHSLGLVVFSLLLGTLMVRYLSRHPTAWAIEFFGLATSCMFLLLLAESHAVSWKRSILLTLLLALSVGMKESFILVIFAGAMLFARSKEQWVRGVIVPTLVTAIIGVLALALLGALKAYFAVYLPQMMGYYVQRFKIPFFLRGLVFDKIFENMSLFSVSFTLLTVFAFAAPLISGQSSDRRSLVLLWLNRMITIIALSVLSATSFVFQATQGYLLFIILFCGYRVFIQKKPARFANLSLAIAAVSMLAVRYICVVIRWMGEVVTGTSVSTAVCTAPSTLLTILLVMAIAITVAVIAAYKTHHSDDRPLLLSIASVELAFFVLYFLILSRVQVAPVWPSIVLPLFVILLLRVWWVKRGSDEGVVLGELLLRFGGFFVVSQSIAMGSDFQGHHFLSIVPFILAVFIPVIDLLARNNKKMVMLWLGALSIVVILNPLRHPSLDDLPSALAASNAQVEAYEAQGKQIDAISTACQFDRYLVLGAGDVYGFTTHSPINYFLWSGIQALNQHPLIRERTLISIADAKVVFIGDQLQQQKDMSEAELGAVKYILDNFSEEIPACAKGIDPPKNVLVLYRKAK